MKLLVISPEKELLNQEVTAVELPGIMGRFMVLTGHAPIISSLTEGVIRYDMPQDEARQELPISGGFVKVLNDEIVVCVG